MLVIHDEKGEVEQVIMIGDFERMRAIYEANGKLVAEKLDITRPDKIWVDNGVVTEMPDVPIVGEVRPIAADGIDSLRFDIPLPTFSVLVFLDGVIVHRETVETGFLDLSVEHPGTYDLTFSAPFPFAPTQISVVAT